MLWRSRFQRIKLGIHHEKALMDRFDPPVSIPYKRKRHREHAHSLWLNKIKNENEKGGRVVLGELTLPVKQAST